MEQQYLHHMDIQHADRSITQEDKLFYPVPRKIYRHNTALKDPKGKYLTYVSKGSYHFKLLKLLLKVHTDKETWLAVPTTGFIKTVQKMAMVPCYHIWEARSRLRKWAAAGMQVTPWWPYSASLIPLYWESPIQRNEIQMSLEGAMALLFHEPVPVKGNLSFSKRQCFYRAQQQPSDYWTRRVSHA